MWSLSYSAALVPAYSSPAYMAGVCTSVTMVGDGTASPGGEATTYNVGAIVEITAPNFPRPRDEHKRKSYSAHIDQPEVLLRCKLTHVHMPRGSRIQFLESFASCHCCERNFDYLN